MVNVWFDKVNELFAKYVPSEGPAETEAGELLRAVGRIVYRFFNDGDQIGLWNGNETCNAPARYIKEQYPDSEMAAAVSAIWGLENKRLYEAGLGMLAEQTVRYIEAHPDLMEKEAEYDCFDFTEPEDTEWDEEDEDEDDEDDYYWGCGRRPLTQRELDLAQYPPLDWRR